MARDDLFRRSFEAGTAFLDMTREKAEALVKELVKAGELQKGKAQKAIDEVLERSRKGAEELRDLIRREVNEQMTSLGLATKEDIDRLEARLTASGGGSATASPDPVTEPTTTPPVTEAGPSKEPGAKKAAKGAAKAAKARSVKAAGPGAGTAGAGGGDAGAGGAGAGGASAGDDAQPGAAKAATAARTARKAAPNPLQDEVRTEVPPAGAQGTGAVPRGGPPSGGPTGG
jgi:polyhydroxyalkanoate synthesis regulator phasin